MKVRGLAKRSDELARCLANVSERLAARSERYGIDSKLINLADSVYHIEMFGQNSSMNVVQAASIALYETTKILDND